MSLLNLPDLSGLERVEAPFKVFHKNGVATVRLGNPDGYNEANEARNAELSARKGINLHGTYLGGYKIRNESLPGLLTDPHPMWRGLVDQIATSKKTTRILVPKLRRRFPDVSEIPVCYQGDNGFTVPPQQVWDKGGRVTIPSVRYIDYETGGISNYEIITAYLQSAVATAVANGCAPTRYKKGIPYHHEGLEEKVRMQPPLYYAGGRVTGDLAYVDLTAAFLSIYRHATLDMDFSVQRRYLTYGGVTFPNSELWYAYKRLRQPIHTVFVRRSVNWMEFGSPVSAEAPDSNEFFAPDLHAWMMCVLHSVAQGVIDNFGAYSVLNDGFIVDAKLARLVQQYLKEVWELDSKIKAIGPGVLYGNQMYDIGSVKTANAPLVRDPKAEVDRNKNRIFDKPVSTIVDIDHSWVQDRRQWLVSQNLTETTNWTTKSYSLPKVKEKVVKERVNNCMECEADITHKISSAKFCNASCQGKWRRRK